ncbi:MAG: helix-turn-helix domain-containing protein, partial [Erysipelotrichaceae bacterium]|nr:helix-turn-helix domain-containing protein [Erysipelotrichaceae bacterium]
AKRLLVDTSDLITDVAYEVGYNNSTHFCTTFRKLTGMSPNSFRKARKRKYGRNDLDVQ